jgi:hypothetical protein
MTTAPLNAHLTAATEAGSSGGALHASGVALAGCATLSLLLLAVHPGGSPQTFAEVLKDEASNQGPDALVHGGFVAVLAIEMVCFAALAARLGAGRVRVLAALVFTAAGSATLAGSMIFDGLLTPAIAVKYLAGPPERLEAARTLISLCGLMIRFLMPMGLAFQAAGILAWSAALAGRGGAGRWTAIAGLVLGGGALAALTITVARFDPMVAMGALGAQALWTAAIGVLMARGRV